MPQNIRPRHLEEASSHTSASTPWAIVFSSHPELHFHLYVFEGAAQAAHLDVGKEIRPIDLSAFHRLSSPEDPLNKLLTDFLLYPPVHHQPFAPAVYHEKDCENPYIWALLRNAAAAGIPFFFDSPASPRSSARLASSRLASSHSRMRTSSPTTRAAQTRFTAQPARHEAGSESSVFSHFDPAILEEKPISPVAVVQKKPNGTFSLVAAAAHPNATPQSEKTGRNNMIWWWRGDDDAIHIAPAAAPFDEGWKLISRTKGGIPIDPADARAVHQRFLPFISAAHSEIHVPWDALSPIENFHTDNAESQDLAVTVVACVGMKVPRVLVHINSPLTFTAFPEEYSALYPHVTSDELLDGLQPSTRHSLYSVADAISRYTNNAPARSFFSQLPFIDSDDEELALPSFVKIYSIFSEYGVTPEGIRGLHSSLMQRIFTHGFEGLSSEDAQKAKTTLRSYPISFTCQGEQVHRLQQALEKLRTSHISVHTIGQFPEFHELHDISIIVRTGEETETSDATTQATPQADAAASGAQAVFTNTENEPSTSQYSARESRNDDILSSSGKIDWFDLHISVKAGGHEVPISQLIETLSRGSTILYFPDGSYINLETPELEPLRTLLEEARTLHAFNAENTPMPRVRTSWWQDLLSLDFVEAASRSWLEKLRASAALRDLSPAPLPRSLTAELRSYQREGYEWLTTLLRYGMGGVLADDMGLGKTLQMLSMIQYEREEAASSPEEKAALRPWIVVAPTSVVGSWKSEARRFTPGLRVVAIDSTDKRRNLGLEHIASHADVIITSYTLLRLESSAYAKLRPRAVVLDEAQNIKNPRSKTYKSVLDVHAPAVFAMTGTPLENNVDDLWAIFSLTSPGLLGTFKEFRETFRAPIDAGGEHAHEQLALLHRRISPFFLRRTKSAVIKDLPSKQEQIIEVELTASHRRAYDRLLAAERQRILALASDNSHKIEVLAGLTRLRQMAIDPSLVEEDSESESSKLLVLAGLLEQAASEGHRALIFSQYTRFLKKIARMLDERGFAYSYLDGATRARSEVIQEFADGDAPFFLISLKAGGVGLNLTMADYAILTDPWWNPAVENQAVDRIHRIGQTKNVHVYRLVSMHTIEEKVVALQTRKRALFDAVVGNAAEGPVDFALSLEDVRLLLSD